MTSEQGSGEASRKKILVVDDEEDVRLFLAEFISELDFLVDTAGNGDAAFEKAQKTQYDIVLLDVMMPGMDGITCLEKIKKLSPQTVVIMITALTDDHSMSAAKKRGATQYIMKPFSLNYLETELRNLLRNPD